MGGDLRGDFHATLEECNALRAKVDELRSTILRWQASAGVSDPVPAQDPYILLVDRMVVATTIVGDRLVVVESRLAERFTILESKLSERFTELDAKIERVDRSMYGVKLIAEKATEALGVSAVAEMSRLKLEEAAAEERRLSRVAADNERLLIEAAREKERRSKDRLLQRILDGVQAFFSSKEVVGILLLIALWLLSQLGVVTKPASEADFTQ